MMRRQTFLRPITLESLDYTFVPSYVPAEFTNTVKNDFNLKTKIKFKGKNSANLAIYKKLTDD